MQFRLTSHGIEVAKRKRTALMAVLSDTELTLRTMSDEPDKLWTAQDLEREIGGGIPPADAAFFTRRLEELEHKGLVEKI